MQHRTWLVSEPYHPELTGTGYYMTALAEALARGCDGRDVHVLCGQPTYANRGERAPRREQRNGVTIRRCRGTTLDKDVLPFRLCNLVTLGLVIFWSALRRLRPGDTVIVVTNPPTQQYLMLLACRLRRARCVVLVHDLYPDIAVAVGLIGSDSPIVRTMRRANRVLMRRADKVVVVGRDMRERCAAISGLDPVDIAVIPNWPEPWLTPERDAGAGHRAAWGAADDDVVVLCAGNLGRANDLEILVEAADRLRHVETLRWVFLGHGVKRQWLVDELVRRSLSSVLVADPEPRAAQSGFLNAADVGLVPMMTGIRGVAVPSRTYNLMAVGVPVLAIVEAGSEVAQVVEEEQAGWVVEPGDLDGLVEALHAIVDQPDDRRVAAKNAAAAARRATFDTAVEAHRKVLAEVEAR